MATVLQLQALKPAAPASQPMREYFDLGYDAQTAMYAGRDAQP